MTVRTARAITYTLVGLFTVAALRATPPLVQAPGSSVLGSFAGPLAVTTPAPVAVVTSASQRSASPARGLSLAPVTVEPNETMVAPVLVFASTKPRVDTMRVSGTIKSSLFTALAKDADEELPRSARVNLAFSLADIFEYRVDMSRDLKVGDEFNILVERLQQPNGAIIINKILGAQLALSGNEIEAIRFDSRAASGEYFDGSGKSLRASFLRAPVAFRRISSIFGGRRHPVLGVWRRHKGTDYAAASGTPVRSIGDGIVVFAGRRGGYGNVIDVRHRNGYVSRYGHLRNFAKGVGKGTRVSIGQTIGAVGQTGMATGPHLHFEVLVNGVQRDPRVALQMKGGEPIPSSERQVFQNIRTRTIAQLTSSE